MSDATGIDSLLARPPATGMVARLRSAWRWTAARPAVLCLLLAAIAALSLARQWNGPVLWDPDSLMYQSQTLELRGTDAETARHDLFFGPLGARARSLDADEPGEPRRVTDPRWVDFASQYYRRRWLLPALAAASYPVLGQESLRTWSLLGYVAVAPLLFLLLRRRFGAGTSFAIALGALALAPLRDWSVIPLTDSWGVALMLAALLAGLAAIERSPGWLGGWFAAILALSITRDSSFVLVAAAVVLAVAVRSRRSIALAATGVLASLPAPLLFGADARGQLAFVANDRTIPPDTGWSFIADHYGGVLRDMARGYGDYRPPIRSSCRVRRRPRAAVRPRRPPRPVLPAPMGDPAGLPGAAGAWAHLLGLPLRARAGAVRGGRDRPRGAGVGQRAGPAVGSS